MYVLQFDHTVHTMRYQWVFCTDISVVQLLFGLGSWWDTMLSLFDDVARVLDMQFEYDLHDMREWLCT